MTEPVATAKTATLPEVVKISDTHYLVRSWSKKHWMHHVTFRKTKYGGKWNCSCPRGVCGHPCHHILEVPENEKTT